LKRGYKLRLRSNLTPAQRKVLNELKADDSIIICPADKGKVVVIEDRETYLSKMQDQIHEGNYEISKKGEKTILRRLHRRIVDQLIAMGIDDWKEQRRFTVTGPVMASMALLIKVHKKNFPGRAYVSQIDDPSYKICQELTRILNPIDEKGESFIQDTYHFKELLGNLEVRDDDLMGSLDVVGMFPNVPLKKTLEVVREELENDDTLQMRTKWEIDDIMKLLEISIETYFKTLDGKIYFQRDGLPIGKSISKPLAGIYMHWFERTYVFNDNNQFKDNIVFWKRQVDDIFFVWKGSKEELELFVWLLNGVEYRVQFTLEVEKEGFLPVLHVGLMKAGGKLVTRIYRKPTHTQQYINWNSNHPKNMLLGVLKGLIHRAHVICDLKEDLLEELDLLKDVFIGNGYPEHLVTKTLNESWPRETLKAVLKGVQQDVEVENQKDFFEVLHAPYVKGFSEGLQRKLRKLQIGLVPKKQDTMYSNLCKLKQKVDWVECKDVIYSVPCKKCGVRYIGETGQHFCQRTKQHQNDIKNKKTTNGFYAHLRKNKGHSINWDGAVFLDRERHWRRRKIKEALFINAQNSAKEVHHKKILNLEKGITLDPVWAEFNETFREIMSRKM